MYDKRSGGWASSSPGRARLKEGGLPDARRLEGCRGAGSADVPRLALLSSK